MMGSGVVGQVVSPGATVTRPACWICHGAAAKTVLCRVSLDYGTEYDLLECSECGVMYVDPLPTQGELDAFYSAQYFDFEPHKYEGRGMAFARKYLRRGKPGRFLDVGCATGFFLNGVRKHSGWEVWGVDAAAPAVRFAAATLGLDVRLGELMDVRFPPASFDFVHVSNVLEHVRQPVAFLQECRRIIAPGGTLYLSVPNGFVDSRDLITFCRLEGPPARSKSGHLFFLPRHTVLKVIHDSGFAIQRSRTYGIRRGLRMLGVLPRSRRWKKPYFPKRTPPDQDSHGEVVVPLKRRHSRFYQLYRFTQAELKMLPGLVTFGLDFQLLLTPGPQEPRS